MWTPLALAVAIAWPVALFYNDAELQKIIVVVSACVFAFALVTLGVSWGLGAPPRTRRTVILHVLGAGVIASATAPYLLTRLLGVVAGYQKSGAAVDVPVSTSAAMAPLALMMGLPITLISGALFAWIALNRPPPDQLGDHIRSVDVQPFH